jgi:hypothetical protein
MRGSRGGQTGEQAGWQQLQQSVGNQGHQSTLASPDMVIKVMAARYCGQATTNRTDCRYCLQLVLHRAMWPTRWMLSS